MVACTIGGGTRDSREPWDWCQTGDPSVSNEVHRRPGRRRPGPTRAVVRYWAVGPPGRGRKRGSPDVLTSAGAPPRSSLVQPLVHPLVHRLVRNEGGSSPICAGRGPSEGWVACPDTPTGRSSTGFGPGWADDRRTRWACSMAGSEPPIHNNSRDVTAFDRVICFVPVLAGPHYSPAECTSMATLRLNGVRFTVQRRGESPQWSRPGQAIMEKMRAAYCLS